MVDKAISTTLFLWQMKRISLTQNKYALVDNEDFEMVNQYKWHFNSQGYAYRYAGGGRLNRVTQAMHHLIAGKLYTDHIDGDGLNNTRSNLRETNKSLNAANSKKRSDNTSGYKGVYRSRWGYYAQITRLGKTYNLGTFKDIKDATRAYNTAAQKHFGEFARLNNV